MEQPESGVQIIGHRALFPGLTNWDLSPDGQTFVGFRGLTMQVWNRPDDRLLKEIEVVPFGYIHCAKFSPKGKFLSVLAQRWEFAVEPEFDSNSNDPMSSDELEDVFKILPQPQNVLLFYNRQWELEHKVLIDADATLSWHSNKLHFAPDESSVVLQCQNELFVYDLEQAAVIRRTPSGESAIYLSATEIALPGKGIVWNWRRDTDRPLSNDMLSGVWIVMARSHDGQWLLTSGTRGFEFLHLPTKRRIPHSSISIFDASFSADGRYAALVVLDGPYKIKLTVHDLEKQQEVASLMTPTIPKAWINSDTNELLIAIRYDFNSNRNVSSMVHSMKLDDNLPSALKSLESVIPPTDHVTFGNHDQSLVLANGLAAIDIQTAKMSTRRFDPRDVQYLAADPRSDRVFIFGGSPMESNSDPYEVQQWPLHGKERKRIMKVSPPPAITAGLGRLFGVQSDAAWSVTPLHLSVSRDGTRVREIHTETRQSTKEPFEIRELRFVIAQFDLATNQLLPAIKLEIPKVESKTQVHVALSSDGQLFGFAQGTFLFTGETAGGTLQHEVRLPGIASHLAFSNDNRWLAVALETPSWRVPGLGIAHNRPLADQIVVIDLDSGTVCWQKRRQEIVAVGFHPTEPKLFITERVQNTPAKHVTFYRESTWEIESQFRSSHGQPLSAAISNDGKSMAFTLADSRTEVWTFSELQTEEK
ncbi:MAG: hypothetical protein Q8M16_02750 [Pirellulaceae bacterium]|nr:hypothetical protein [Pirellulaceae bacterium]